MRMTVAPGTTPPCASRTVPATFPVVICADTTVAVATPLIAASTHNRSHFRVLIRPSLSAPHDPEKDRHSRDPSRCCADYATRVARMAGIPRTLAPKRLGRQDRPVAGLERFVSLSGGDFHDGDR